MLKCAEIYTHTHTHTHGCLCKIIIPIIATFAITIPTYANIDKDAQSATCDNSTIGTTTGPANLQADWTANTINLDWYDGDTKLTVDSTSATCTYDDSITLPSIPTVPTGYTFGGWQVRPRPFNLATLASVIDVYANGYGYKHLDGSNNKDDALYGLTKPGEWATGFSYGNVMGIAICSVTPGSTKGQTGTASETKGQYCWCQVQGFDPEKDKTYLNVSSNPWVFRSRYAQISYCEMSCAYNCSYDVMDRDFRVSVYGLNQ